MQANFPLSSISLFKNIPQGTLYCTWYGAALHMRKGVTRGKDRAAAAAAKSHQAVCVRIGGCDVRVAAAAAAAAAAMQPTRKTRARCCSCSCCSAPAADGIIARDMQRFAIAVHDSPLLYDDESTTRPHFLSSSSSFRLGFVPRHSFSHGVLSQIVD